MHWSHITVPQRDGHMIIDSTQNKCILTHHLIIPCSNWKSNQVVELSKKFRAFYGTKKYITVLITPSHWILPWARLIQSKSFQHFLFVYVNIILPLYIPFHVYLFQQPSSFHVSQQNFAGVSVLTCMLHALCMSSSSLNQSVQYSLTNLRINNITVEQLAFSRRWALHRTAQQLHYLPVRRRRKCVYLVLKIDLSVSSTQKFISASSMSKFLCP